MNIHGHKLKIKKIKEELKLGEKKLGSFRFNVLVKRKNMHNRIIKSLRNKKIKKK